MDKERQRTRVVFIGAGKIAQSALGGIARHPDGKNFEIWVLAPSLTNLNRIEWPIVSKHISDKTPGEIKAFSPEVVFLCVKPHIFRHRTRLLGEMLESIPKGDCLVVSVMAGVCTHDIKNAMSSGFERKNVIRVMFNVAAELRESNAFLYMDNDLGSESSNLIESMVKMFAPTTTKLSNESLIGVATGVTGSGLAFLYETIQAISDVGVKNGLSRQESLEASAQLAIAAGKMCLTTKRHPYQLRDDVASPAGCTIHGLDKWHEQGINHRIGQAFQESIDRANKL